MIKLFRKYSKKQLLFLTAWLLIMAGVLLFLNLHNSYNSDEGVLYEGAWRLAKGQKIYYDFFEFVSPGGFFLVHFFWKIFGVSYFGPKIFSLLIILLSCVGLVKIAKKLGADNSVYFLLIAFALSTVYLPIVHYHIFFLSLLVWGAYYFLVGFENRATGFIVLSGLIIGLSGMFMLHKGLVVASVFLLFLLFLYWRSKDFVYLKYVAVFGFSFAVVLLLYLFWPIDLLYRDLIDFPANHYLEVNHFSLNNFVIFLIVYVYLFWRLRKSNSKIIFILVLQGIGLLFSLQRPDINHLATDSIFFYCLIPLLAVQAATLDRLARYLIYVVLGVYLIFPAIVIYTGSVLNNSNASAFFDYIKENCQSDTIYFGPYLPHLYFLSQKTNPTPFPFLVTRHNTSEQFSLAAKLLEERQPDCMIMNYEMVRQFNYSKTNPVDEFISKKYYLDKQFGAVQMFKLDR